MFSLRWIHTSDIHGALFLEDKEKSHQETHGTTTKDVQSDNIIISDGGDQLQGNAVTYYCNHLSDASQPHIIAEAMNSMKYDVACLGNHEYYAGAPNSLDFYRKADITLLRDSVITLGDLCIVGRDDRSHVGRKSVSQLMRQADKGKYVILLDHQPYHLEHAEKAGVDFQLSGHTH